MMRRMHPAAIGLVAVLTQLLITKANAAAGDDSDNQAEFNALCRLIRAAQTGFAAPPDKLSTIATSAFADIQRAHIMAGDNDTKIMEALKSKVADQKPQTKLLPQTEAGRTAKRQINETYNVALKIKEAAEGIATQKAEDIKAANKLLAQALKGDEGRRTDNGDAGDYFKSTADPQMFGDEPAVAKNCGGTGAGANNGQNTGVTLLNDFACLCLIGPNGGHKKLFAATATTVPDNAPQYDNAASTLKPAYSAMIKKCHKQHAKITPQYLAAALNGFTALIGTQARQASSNADGATHILGYAANGNTGCTGGDSQVCVNYKVQLGNAAATGIPWANKLQLAIQKATATEPGPKLEAAEASLQQLNTTIWKLYDSGFRIEAGRQIESATQQPVEQKKFEECKRHGPKKTCEENNCRWDGKTETEGECKPKDAEGQTNAAGAGETATGVYCSKKQTQQVCEAENKNVKAGERAFCGWINFVDGTGKLPKPECRSFSFLVNQKFSLIAATFVSLLLFIFHSLVLAIWYILKRL